MMKRILGGGVAVLGMACAVAALGEIRVDVGGSNTGGPQAPTQEGWTGWITPDRLGGAALSQGFSADFDDSFTVAIDKTDTRLRSTVDPSVPLAQMLTTAFKSPDPIVMRIQGLDAGEYQMTMWHHDANRDAKPSIDIQVSDADGANRLVVDDLAQSWNTGPVFSKDRAAVPVPVGPTEPVTSTFSFRSDGASEVVIQLSDNDDVVALYGATYQGATVASNWNEAFIAGFAIVPEPSTIGLVLLGCAAIGLRCRRW